MSETETAGQGPESIDLGGSVRIPEVLQVCHLTQKTGVLDIFNEDRAARLYLDRGRIVHAQFGDDAGIGAAVEALLLDRAQASFTPDVTTFRHTIQMGLSEILHMAAERGARLPKGMEAGGAMPGPVDEGERYPVLQVLFGGEFLHYRLDKEQIILGRTATSDIVIQDETVSRRHALFEIRDEFVLLHDLNSSNGTFLCGHRVADAVLAPGDRVVFGDIPCEFTWKALVEIPPPPQLKVVPQRGRFQTHILPPRRGEAEKSPTAPIPIRAQAAG